jgi:5-methylcytosine-specific restriction endonuclease McrA
VGIDQLRRIREERDIPKPRKWYTISRVSPKRQKKLLEQKATLEADKEFYKEIWLASAHVCQCGCQAKLGKEPLLQFFHHLLFKSKYPQFRHTPENIMILHPDCHNSYHANPLTRPEVTRRQKEAEKILL